MVGRVDGGLSGLGLLGHWVDVLMVGLLDLVNLGCCVDGLMVDLVDLAYQVDS